MYRLHLRGNHTSLLLSHRLRPFDLNNLVPHVTPKRCDLPAKPRRHTPETVILTQPRRPEPWTAHFAHNCAQAGFWTYESNCSWLSVTQISIAVAYIPRSYVTLTFYLTFAWGLRSSATVYSVYRRFGITYRPPRHHHRYNSPLLSQGLLQKLLPAVPIPCSIPPISLPQLPGIFHHTIFPP